jgi:glycosyltransferase involved in cell wall biosynthesis
MRRKVNIVHFTSQPGGIEVIIPQMVENLNDIFFSSFVIRPSKLGEENIYDGVSVGVSYGTKGRSSFYYLYKYARKNKNEIFHVFNIGPIALLFLRLAGVKKLVYGIHGTIYWRNWKEKLIRKIIWKIAMSSNYIVTANSLFSGKIFKEIVLKKAAPILLYNPFNAERFRPGLKKKDFKNLKIVYSGRLAKGKNLNKWIYLASELHKKNPDLRFELFGEGPQKKLLQELINELMLNEIVILKGFSGSPEEIYQNADILLFLSEYESFGNVVIESIMCETPVIVSDIPSMLEIFRDFPEFIVPLDECLLEHILLKIEQIDILRELAAKAAEEFRNKFSLNQHISSVKKLYASFNS